MVNEGQWTVDEEQWTVDAGQWTVDGGRRTADSGRRTADSRQWTSMLVRLQQTDIYHPRRHCQIAGRHATFPVIG